MAYGSVTVTTNATLIIPANANRVSYAITNTSATIDLYVGPDSSVSASNGLLITTSGGSISEDPGGTSMYKGDIYGITSSSTSDVRYWERVDNR
jgi:hypothetical protein